MSKEALTFGEKAVGLTFDPDGDIVVEAVKEAYSHVIDALNSLREGNESPEIKRMLSIAITDAQTSQMWAVKAITWKH
jgi:hypothetical protein